MSIATPYPAQLDFHGDRHITRWRPLVQWLLAVPHLLVARALNALRSVLTLISLFAILFTKKIPRPLFDAIAMTYRYEWRSTSYALFLHETYALFDFQPTAEDDGDLGRIGVRLELFEALAKGFLREAAPMLTPVERSLLVFSGRLITLEQAVRFMTDYVEGDHYYHDTRGDQNLRRARAQLQLYLSLTEREAELNEIVAGI